MADQAKVRTIIDEDDVKSFEQALSALELNLATVQKVIERNANESLEEDSHNGVHLSLYVMHTKAVIMLCRQLLESNEGVKS
jgi:hypothetical protein